MQWEKAGQGKFVQNFSGQWATHDVNYPPTLPPPVSFPPPVFFVFQILMVAYFEIQSFLLFFQTKKYTTAIINPIMTTLGIQPK
jgi:hypothetical protein